MRFLDLHFLKFGCFDDARLDFGDGLGTLHVVYGANEAGKSTALRAITSLLYRIEGQTPDNFRFAYNQLRIGGTLKRDDGSECAFVRKKANKEDLLGADGSPVPETLMAECLGRAGLELFSRMFRLDHESIRQGGEQLREGKGELAPILFAAGAGATDLQRIQAALDSEADRIFKPRRLDTTISLALAARSAALDRLGESGMEAAEHHAHEERKQELERRAEELRTQMGQLHAEVRRLERLSRCAPRARRWQEVLRRIGEIGEVPLLPANARDRRLSAALELENVTDARHQLNRQMRDLQNDIVRLTVADALVERGPEIDRLSGRLGAHEKAREDLPKRRAELQQLVKQAQEIARKIDPALTPDAMGYLNLPAADARRIRLLSDDYRPLFDRRRQLKDELAEEEAALQAADERLKELPDIPEIATLKGAVAAARQRGDLTAQRARAESAVNLAAGKLASLAAALPLLRGEPEAVESLRVPTTETVDRFDAELQRLAGDEAARHTEREALRTELDQLHEAIRALELAGSVPSEADLAVARGERDRDWQALKQTWRGAPSAELAARLEDQAPAYEQQVASADEVSDRLRREADRVAKRAGHASRIEALERRESEIAEALATLEQERRNHQTAWASAWAQAEIEPLSPREMRAWLGKHEAAVRAAQQLQEQRTGLAEAEAGIADSLKRLRAALSGCGHTDPAADDLPALLGLAEDVIERAETARQDRSALTNEIAGLKARVERKRHALQAKREECASWKERWFESIAPLRLPEKTLPAEAVAVLEQADLLFQKQEDVEGLEARIHGMEEDAQRFGEDVARLAAAVAPELGASSPEDAARQMIALWDRAKRDLELRQQREGDLARDKKRLLELSEQMQRATAAIRQLVQEAGCTELSELPAVEERSFQLQALLKESSDLEQQIALDGGGASAAEIVREAENEELDSLPFRVAELRRETDRLDTERSPVERELGGILEQLAKLDRSGEAAAARAEVESITAGLEQNVARYVRVKLASAVLRRAIEEYRGRHQQPLLLRAGVLFQRMTLGRFERLAVGYPDEKPVILGVRPGGEEVGVGGMSEGTRDALYLALRLASLEQQLETGSERLPFIVDDILIKLDDDRARATLGILAELAAQTQVLFFTHHARMVDLARELPTDHTVAFHSLENAALSEYSVISYRLPVVGDR